jgi:hypothetical protein
VKTQDDALERELVDLAALAGVADALPPVGEHLTLAEFAAVRIGDETDEEVGVGPAEVRYRHLAQCGLCRARLVEDGRAVATKVPAAVAAPAAVPAEVVRPARWSPRLRAWTPWAAAAVVLLAAYSGLRARGPEPLSIAQRSYVGVMGEGATVVSPRAGGKNVELSFRSSSVTEAIVVAVDARGERLGPPVAFERRGEGEFVAVVAPRLFPAHAAPVTAYIVAGSASEVAAATAMAERSASLDGAAAWRGELAGQRGRDARVEQVTLAEP